MFYNTFYSCTGLNGTIPSGLFGSISGVPAQSMFEGTFRGCTGLTGLGGFENATFTMGAASGSISNTFSGCTGATGASPSDKNGTKFYSWDTIANGLATFYNDINLSDYATIPANRK